MAVKYRLYKQNRLAEHEYVGTYSIPELLLVIMALSTERVSLFLEPVTDSSSHG